VNKAAIPGGLTDQARVSLVRLDREQVPIGAQDCRGCFSGDRGERRRRVGRSWPLECVVLMRFVRVAPGISPACAGNPVLDVDEAKSINGEREMRLPQIVEAGFIGPAVDHQDCVDGEPNFEVQSRQPGRFSGVADRYRELQPSSAPCQIALQFIHPASSLFAPDRMTPWRQDRYAAGRGSYAHGDGIPGLRAVPGDHSLALRACDRSPHSGRFCSVIS